MRRPATRAGVPAVATAPHHPAVERRWGDDDRAEAPRPEAPPPPSQGRREVLAVAALAAASGLSAPGARPAAAQGAPSPAAPAPRMARPAPGDTLVFATGERSGKPIELSDLALGGPQVLAWAVEPGSGVVRNGSRLNQIVLVRLDPASMDQATASRAVEGVVAYSAVCTHAQCPVSEWRHEPGVLHCPCHHSEFDPKQGGKVVGGPAPRPLAALPLKVVEEPKPAESDKVAGGAPAAGGNRTAEAAGSDPGGGGAAAGGGGAASAGGVLVVARPFVGKLGTSS